MNYQKAIHIDVIRRELKKKFAGESWTSRMDNMPDVQIRRAYEHLVSTNQMEEIQ